MTTGTEVSGHSCTFMFIIMLKYDGNVSKFNTYKKVGRAKQHLFKLWVTCLDIDEWGRAISYDFFAQVTIGCKRSDTKRCE